MDKTVKDDTVIVDEKHFCSRKNYLLHSKYKSNLTIWKDRMVLYF